MNINLLNKLVLTSKMSKLQIAEKCNLSRTTLDNVLAGADAKVSTIETLAKVLGVKTSSLFEDETASFTEHSEQTQIKSLMDEINRLQGLLNTRKSAKVVVELDLDDDEFIKMGLKEKMIQILNKR